MEFPIFFIFVFIVLTVIIYRFFFSKKAKIKRKLSKTPLKQISDFKDNEIAKIIGQVEIIGQPLISPLALRECTYYYVKIEHQVSSGKSSHWETIIEEELLNKFLIKDGLDYAYLNDRNIKSYIVQDQKFSSGFGNDATQRLEKYLNSKGHESEGFLGFNKTLRYFEGVIENNEKIAISGKGNWKNAKDFGLPIKADKVLEITSDEIIPIYLSDDPDTTTQKTTKDKEVTTVKSNTSSFNNRRNRN